MEANLVQPVPSVYVQSNTGVVPCMIVPEVLKENNYERWSIFMQHYLVAQDLWNIVLSSEMPRAEDPRDWIKKNALALHAIKISCGVESFDQIKMTNLANDAWNALADLHKQPNEDATRGIETDTEATWKRMLDNNERTEFVSLLKDILFGDWNALKNLDGITEIIFPGGFTVLHIATIAGHLSIVKELVKIAGEDYLEKQDDNGDTALTLAACYNGKVKIAECLVQKNDKLLTIQNKEGYIPLVVACINHKKDMASYLYSITQIEFLFPENSNQGTLFLNYCVLNFISDVGLDLLFRCPRLAASRESITISDLSVQPSLFASKLPFRVVMDWFLYQCLDVVELPSPSDDIVSKSRLEIFKRQAARVEVMDRILGLFFFLCHRTGTLKKIYSLKLTHTYANLVLCHWCKEISTYRDATQLVESGAISTIFQAIKGGTWEIVIEILKANPDLIWCDEKLSRNILISAIKYRQRRILRFLYRLDAGKKALLSFREKEGNNALHLVAKLADRCPSNDVHFRAAWIMNLEEKWFEEVRSYLPCWYQEAKNLYDETPDQVFDREHQKLAKEMDEWGKKTAESYSLASVLIVTIMFAALFTVPGGNNQETGIPTLLHRKLFSGFLICDAVSIVTASTSFLGFLSTLIGSFSRKPRQMRFFYIIFSNSTLIISIVTMILAFIFALSLMLENKWQVLPAIITYLLVVLSLAFFNWQFPILISLFMMVSFR